MSWEPGRPPPPDPQNGQTTVCSWEAWKARCMRAEIHNSRLEEQIVKLTTSADEAMRKADRSRRIADEEKASTKRARAACAKTLKTMVQLRNDLDDVTAAMKEARIGETKARERLDEILSRSKPFVADLRSWLSGKSPPVGTHAMALRALLDALGLDLPLVTPAPARVPWGTPLPPLRSGPPADRRWCNKYGGLVKSCKDAGDSSCDCEAP